MNTTFTDLSASLLRGQQSDVGKRPNQEDRWEIREFQTADGRPATLALVADGIGGHNTGEIASQMAKEMIPARLLASPPSASEITRRLKAVLEETGQAIYDESLKDLNRSGMGTTCTAIAVVDKRLYLAHVGDSRAYLLRGGVLRQLTVDHTWAEAAISAGRPAEEIRTHPNRGVIMRYLGIDPTVSIDTRYRVGPGANELVDALQAGPLHLEPGDTLLLCSDGVSDALDARQVAAYLAQPDCQAAADALVADALKAGATDNVTALVLRLPGGTVVAPPAAQAAAGKKLPVLALVLAALGLVLVGVVATLALSGRGRSAPTPTPSAAVSQAPTARGTSAASPRAEATGGGVLVATQTLSTSGPSAATAAATLPVISGTSAISATATVSGTVSASGEPTLVPTFTVAPTRAPSTATPRASATSRTPTVTPGGQSGSSSGGVKLLRPAENEKIQGPIEFAWEDQPGFRLKPGELYELIIWGLDEDPMRHGRSPVAGTDKTAVQANLPDSEAVLNLTAGRAYYWGVALMKSNGTRIGILSEGRKFNYERSGPACTGGDCNKP